LYTDFLLILKMKKTSNPKQKPSFWNIFKKIYDFIYLTIEEKHFKKFINKMALFQSFWRKTFV
jgi:hypothetical protein